MAQVQKPNFVFRRKGGSVQTTAGGRDVHISSSNAGFPGSVKGTGYPFHWPVSLSLLQLCGIMYHYISTGLYWL